MEKIIEEKYFSNEEMIEEITFEELKDEENYKYFEGTVNFTKFKESQYIIPFLEKDTKIIGRQFLDINKNVKYLEIFKNEILDLLGISKNITFLHSYSNDEKDHYNPNKFIGFRYYEENPQKNGKLFTLVRRNYSDYFILEKNEFLKDMEGNTFFERDLDCYRIIRKIIFGKYKNKIIGNNGDTLPELIGFCFSLMHIKNNKYFKFVSPLIANLGIKKRLKDSVPPKITDNKIYVESFIYDGHVSLIIVIEDDENRYNFILDMSGHHFKKGNPIFFFLPKSLRTYRNIINPPKPIQEYSSCCLWLYGEIECLISSDKYSSLKSIYAGLNMDYQEFYIDVINFLSKEIDGIECLVKIENEKYDDKNADKIDFNRLVFRYLKKFYAVHMDIIFSKFLNVHMFENELFIIS